MSINQEHSIINKSGYQVDWTSAFAKRDLFTYKLRSVFGDLHLGFPSLPGYGDPNLPPVTFN